MYLCSRLLLNIRVRMSDGLQRRKRNSETEPAYSNIKNV